MDDTPAGDQDQIKVVERHAARAAFGQPLIQNNLRAIVVEAMVDLALSAGWRWCAADWAGWDFEHADGTRLEVKQSAARQTWAAPKKPGQRRFDVALRRGHWEGPVWIEAPGRQAHIYLFADHPVAGDGADHRDPDQWLFYPVLSRNLPPTQTISLARVGLLAKPCPYSELASCVDQLRANRE